MKRAFRITLTAGACMAALAAPASAQTLTEIGGTLGLTDTLGGTNYPSIQTPEICSTTSLPDLDEEGNVIQRETTCTGTTPAPATEAPTSTARANGYYCRPLKGTSLRRCVAAMKKLRSGAVRSPARACAGLSRRRNGARQTPYSRCVSGGKKLLADLT